VILRDHVLLFVFPPDFLYDVHVDVWDAVISSGGAERTRPGALLFHEEFVLAAFSGLGPSGAHQVTVRASFVQDEAAAA